MQSTFLFSVLFGERNVPPSLKGSVRVFRGILLGGSLLLAAALAQAQTITQIIDSTGDGAGNGLSAPFDIATDPSGNVFVTGAGSDNAFKIAAPDVVPPLPASIPTLSVAGLSILVALMLMGLLCRKRMARPQ